jgi:uncharacterized membrane protein AbrB (regulator of aidB expression)
MENLKFLEIAIATGFFLHCFGLERQFRLNAWWVAIGFLVVVFGLALGVLINFEFSYELIVKMLNLEPRGIRYTLVHVTVLLGYGILISSLIGIVYSFFLKVKRSL